jgi:hypothetical protein
MHVRMQACAYRKLVWAKRNDKCIEILVTRRLKKAGKLMLGFYRVHGAGDMGKQFC